MKNDNIKKIPPQLYNNVSDVQIYLSENILVPFC